MTLRNDLATPYLPNWCPGCGNLGIWSAFKKLAVDIDLNNSNTVMVEGIGCHGHIVNFVKITSFETLHGRPIPVATGIKLANNRLNVFVFTGDGDCLAEGGNHFIHACRRNHDIKIFIHDNAIYSLTTGQTSPASPHGFKSKSTPFGNPDQPFSPVTLAIASGAKFVARAYSSDINNLTKLMKDAYEHKGIAIIDVLQPCVTFNNVCTHEYYQANTYYLDDSYNPADKVKALEKSLEWGEKKIPLGIIYKEKRPAYEDQIKTIEKTPLIEHSNVRDNIGDLFKKYC